MGLATEHAVIDMKDPEEGTKLGNTGSMTQRLN